MYAYCLGCSLIMNARTWFVYISLFAGLFSGCGSPSLRATQLRTSYQDIELPEFIDDPAPQTNMDLATPRQELVFYRNYGSIKEILKSDSTRVREEMARRAGSSQPMSLRLLAAAVWSSRMLIKESSSSNLKPG